MPIIGPILFSLFILSPYFMPSADSEKSVDLASNSAIEEKPSPDDHSLENSDVNHTNRQNPESHLRVTVYRTLLEKELYFKRFSYKDR